MTRITWKSQSPFPTFYGVPIKNLCLDFSYVILIMFLKKKLAKHNCKHEFQLRFCFFSVIMCIHSIAIPNRPCKIGYPAWMSVRTKRNKKKTVHMCIIFDKVTSIQPLVQRGASKSKIENISAMCH